MALALGLTPGELVASLAAFCLVCACTEPKPEQTEGSARMPATAVQLTPSATSTLAPRPSTERAIDDETSTRPVELLALRLTSDVKNKEPVDAVTEAVVGEKLFAHVTIRNRTGRSRTVELVFTVEGAERGRVPLEIGESWSWRSWAYATPRQADVGKPMLVELVDDEGLSLAERRVDVRAKR